MEMNFIAQRVPLNMNSKRNTPILILCILSVTPLMLAMSPDQQLLRAAHYRDVAPVIDAINHGANINARSSTLERETPLHIATYEQNNMVVQTLLKRGADPNIKTSRGMAPLHFAAELGNTNIINALAANGADLNVPDNEGNTPLHVAVMYNKRDAVRALLGAGADHTIVNNDNITPLELAQQKRYERIVSLLLLHRR